MKLISAVLSALVLSTSIASADYVNLGTDRIYIAETFQSLDGQVFGHTTNDTWVSVDPSNGATISNYENPLFALEDQLGGTYVPAFTTIETAIQQAAVNVLLEKYADKAQGQSELGYGIRIIDFIGDEVISEYFAATPTQKYIEKQQYTVIISADGSAKYEINKWRDYYRWHLLTGWNRETQVSVGYELLEFDTVTELNIHLGL